MNTSMNISLPESLKEFVHERCDQGDYSNPSDYVRALIREDKKRYIAQPDIAGTAGDSLLRFAGAIADEDLKDIAQAIDEDCEKVDSDEW